MISNKIFAIPSEKSQLKSSNFGVEQVDFLKLNATRSVEGTSFPLGLINFDWSTQPTQYWIPSQSFLRVRLQIKKTNGKEILLNDDCALAQNAVSTMFKSSEFLINGKSVCRNAENHAQVSTLERRLYTSKSKLDSYINSLENWGSFKERRNRISSDYLGEVKKSYNIDWAIDATTGLVVKPAVDDELKYDKATGKIRIDVTGNGGAAGARGAGDFATSNIKVGHFIQLKPDSTPLKITEITAKILTVIGTSEDVTVVTDATNLAIVKILEPETVSSGVQELCFSNNALSIFKLDHSIPTGSFRISYNPQSSLDTLKSYMLESSVGKLNIADFEINIVNMHMYIATVNSAPFTDGQYLLDLENTSAQMQDVSGPSYMQRNFNVSPSTYALSVAFHDNRYASDDTRISPTIFHTYESGSDVGPVVSTEHGLSRFAVRYSSMTAPNPSFDIQEGAKNDSMFLYLNSQHSNLSYMDTGGSENFEEWSNERGPYHSYMFPKNPADRSTMVSVHTSFKPREGSGTDTPTVNMNVMLFSHSRSVAKISIKNSTVVDVDVQDV